MVDRILLLVGTKKGAFIIESDPGRRAWQVREPTCDGWPIQDINVDPATGTLYAGGGSPWYGPTVWRSTDLGETWSQSSEGLTYGEGQPAVTRVWNITAAHGALYAGVEPAGLFRSSDGGVTWEHVAGLRAHPSTEGWQPGNGGLILHSIVPHPTDRIVVFVHGLTENDRSWWPSKADVRTGSASTYGERLRADLGYTPVYFHYNSGLRVSDNGRALAEALDHIATRVDAWTAWINRVVSLGAQFKF